MEEETPSQDLLVHMNYTELQDRNPGKREPISRRVRETQIREREEREVKTETFLTKVVTRLMLATIMPNGKQFGACKAPYLNNLGGAFQKVAAKIGNRRVDEVFDDAQLKSLVR